MYVANTSWYLTALLHQIRVAMISYLILGSGEVTETFTCIEQIWCIFLCSLSLIGSSIASDKEYLVREQVINTLYYVPMSHLYMQAKGVVHLAIDCH